MGVISEEEAADMNELPEFWSNPNYLLNRQQAQVDLGEWLQQGIDRGFMVPDSDGFLDFDDAWFYSDFHYKETQAFELWVANDARDRGFHIVFEDDDVDPEIESGVVHVDALYDLAFDMQWALDRGRDVYEVLREFWG